ncbi:hypothetical protein E2562_035055 [Oryza meyeriana var. granulata]|uniref:Retrotransposon gag domain-containing protein n=1 Tax=Oryza meyeriana var. granulata TaxID=110450 RepID=A0A6G1CJE4_9ORYZ|nr:hypothetical protein E2562_035055 [Oryza meyeriana var. granulata]
MADENQENEEIGNNSVDESQVPSRGGCGRGRGSGRHDQATPSNQVENEHMGAEEDDDHSVAESQATHAAKAIRGMTLTRWTSMWLDTFDGTGTPVSAADWLCKMEKYMNGSRMALEEKADIWWEGVVEAWNPARGAIPWEVFLQQFRAKYYPESFRDRMSDELNHI